MSGYYIDNLGNRKELLSKKLYLPGMNLVELVLPENCIFCSCTLNKLTKLIINPNCETLHCSYNQLTELIIPENCDCDCYYNKFSKFMAYLIMNDTKLSNRIFKMKDCKLKSMLSSEDEETFKLGLEILKNI